MRDDTVLAFTGFVAAAQILVGVLLLAIGSAGAVRIIGVVILVLGVLSAASTVYAARHASKPLDPPAPEPGVGPDPR